MKQILVLLCAVIGMLSITACSGGIGEEVEKAIIAECDRYIEEFDYSDTSLYEVHSITYEIHEIKRHNGQILVDITWKVYYEDAAVSASISKEYWVSNFAAVLAKELSADGKYFFVTHTDEVYCDSIRVEINGGEAYSGYDDYQNTVNPTKTDGERKPGVTDDNACARCDGTGKVTKHYGNSWNDQPGYKYGETCGACGGSGIK